MTIYNVSRFVEDKPFLKNDMVLPIQAQVSESSDPIMFWWDNFEWFVDTSTEGGSIQNTPGIAFQEGLDDRMRWKD